MTDQTEADAILSGVTPAGWLYESAGLDWSEIRFDQYEVTPHGQTETALYTADQLLAAVREAVAGKWLPIESAPLDEPILAAIKVFHKNGSTWWERHVIVIDSETGTISDMDFHHGWEADDYSHHYIPLPTAPQDITP